VGELADVWWAALRKDVFYTVGSSFDQRGDDSMNLELNEQERDLLMEVLESRTSELHPEIRRCMDHIYKDDLKKKLACYVGLLERLKTNAASAD
jgi:hypothetical protein